MDVLVKNTQFNFRTNDELLAKAKEIVSSENLDMASIMNSVLQKIVEDKSVPIELIDEKSTRHERIVNTLYDEIYKGYDSFLKGKGKTVNEVFKKYELQR